MFFLEKIFFISVCYCLCFHLYLVFGWCYSCLIFILNYLWCSYRQKIKTFLFIHFILKFYTFVFIGALTSKLYEFRSRPWEIQSIATFDIFDSWCNSIFVDVRGNSILRILPRVITKFDNFRWLNDRSRLAFSGLKTQRIFFPWVKKQSTVNNNLSLVGSDWGTAFNLVLGLLYNGVLDLVLNFQIGPLVDCESSLSCRYNFLKIKKLKTFFWSNCLLNGVVNMDFQNFFSCNVSIKNLNFNSDLDCIFFLLVNIRYEFPFFLGQLKRLKKKKKKKLLIKSLNCLRTLRKKMLFIDNVLCISFGCSSLDNNFMFYGGNLSFFWIFCQGRLFLSKILLKLAKSVIFCGERLLNRIDSYFFQNFFNLFQNFLVNIFNKVEFKINYNKSNVLQNNYLILGLVNQNNLTNYFFKNLLSCFDKNILGSYSLDTFDVYSDNDLFLYNFSIYQGYLGSFTNSTKIFNIDVVLPCLNFYEKISTYFSGMFLLRKSEFILTPSKLIFSDWLIFELNSIYFGYYSLLQKPKILCYYFKNYNLSVFYSLTIHLGFIRNYFENFQNKSKSNFVLNSSFFSLTNEMFLFVNRLQRDLISFNSQCLNSCVKFYSEFNFF